MAASTLASHAIYSYCQPPYVPASSPAAQRPCIRSPATQSTSHDRWGSWEKDVLSRLPEPADLQKIILERQSQVDVEEEEATMIECYVSDRLAKLGYDPSREWVYVPSQTLNRWYREATNERLSTTQTTQIVKQLITEGRIKRLTYKRTADNRGFCWTPESPGTAIATDLDRRIAMQEIPE